MLDNEDSASPMASSCGNTIQTRREHKRPRLRIQRFSASTALKFAMALSCIAAVSCFTPYLSTTRTCARLEAQKKQEDVRLHQVKPRSVSVKDRERAVEAMAIQQEHEAAVVNGHVLEMLSDSFLYPSSQKPYSRPRGRPEMVPGAMTYETMLNYRQRAKALQDGKISVSAYVNDFTKDQRDVNARVENTQTPEVIDAAVVRGRGRPRKVQNGVKGGRRITATAESKPGPKLSSEPLKTRKRVMKNLPKARGREEEAQEAKVDESITFISSKRRKTTVAADLQKYYRTELLTAKEEYSLGIQVQFMVKCESVHEGLALKLERLPSMVEWAHACG